MILPWKQYVICFWPHLFWGSVSICYMGVSKNRGTPKWMVKIMENPIKMDDLGVPLFLETSTWIWGLCKYDSGYYLPPQLHCLVSGQIMIFHQPRFFWNKRFPLQNHHFGWGRVRSLCFDKLVGALPSSSSYDQATSQGVETSSEEWQIPMSLMCATLPPLTVDGWDIRLTTLECNT